MLKNIPHVQRETFPKHFIVRAIMELRFQPKDFEWEKLKCIVESDAKKLNYSSVFVTQESSFELKADPQKDQGKIGIAKLFHAPVGLSGFSSEGTNVFELKRDRLIISTSSYKGFGDFWLSVVATVEALAKSIVVTEFTWIGLRKINQIAIASQNQEYSGEGINPLFLQPLRKDFIDKSAIKCTDSRYILSEKGLTCVINLKTIRDSDPKLTNITMDFDINQKLDSPLDIKTLQSIVEELNDTHFDIFMWATDKTLIDEMKKN